MLPYIVSHVVQITTVVSLYTDICCIIDTGSNVSNNNKRTSVSLSRHAFKDLKKEVV